MKREREDHPQEAWSNLMIVESNQAPVKVIRVVEKAGCEQKLCNRKSVGVGRTRYRLLKKLPEDLESFRCSEDCVRWFIAEDLKTAFFLFRYAIDLLHVFYDDRGIVSRFCIV